MTRTDTHKPSLLDPAEYTFEAAFYQGSSEAMHKAYGFDHIDYSAAIARYDSFSGNHENKGTCDHCGAAFAHGALFLHTPTAQLIHIGHICAENTVGLPSKAAAARKRAERAQAEANEKAKRLEATQAWRNENQGLVDFLAAPQTHPFLQDMQRALQNYGSLTERQAAATAKFAAKAAEFAARDAEREATKVTPEQPLTEGRREIKGEVVSTKWQDSDYGTSLKMLVVEADGNKVWGTVPSAHGEEIKGSQVSFTATVTRSDRDENFGFYRRPTNLEVIS